MFSIFFYLKLYLLTLIFFLGIDFIWLTRIAQSFYKGNIGHLMALNPNLWAAGIFYASNIIGIIIFATLPALNKGSLTTALVNGALFGFFTYATYDLTNFATLRDWPLKVVLVDISWGILITAITAGASYLIATKLL